MFCNYLRFIFSIFISTITSTLYAAAYPGPVDPIGDLTIGRASDMIIERNIDLRPYILSPEAIENRDVGFDRVRDLLVDERNPMRPCIESIAYPPIHPEDLALDLPTWWLPLTREIILDGSVGLAEEADHYTLQMMFQSLPNLRWLSLKNIPFTLEQQIELLELADNRPVGFQVLNLRFDNELEWDDDEIFDPRFDNELVWDDVEIYDPRIELADDRSVDTQVLDIQFYNEPEGDDFEIYNLR